MKVCITAIRTAIASLLLIGAASVSQSQILPESQAPRPCTSNCTDTTAWVYYTGGTTTTPGCVIEVSFWHRYACGYYEISIVDLTMYGSGCNFDSALKYSMIDIIKYNPMSFPFPTNGCSDIIKVTNSACWREFHEVISPTFSKTHYQPCSNNICCYVILRVCDNNGVRTANTILPETGEPPVINCTPDCPNFSCETQRKTFPPVGSIINPQDEENGVKFSRTMPDSSPTSTPQSATTSVEVRK